MKKLWKKAKRFFKKVLTHPETPALTSILVSAYYIGGGLALAFNAQSIIVFTIFCLPALIWWAVTITNIILVPAYATYN
jgi:hypothetical protein